ncbi:hypothetical protein, partial [Sphingobium jiangsuense]
MKTAPRPICLTVARIELLALAATAALTIGATAPIAAQSSDQKPAAPQPRMLYLPGRGTVLVQPAPTDDPRAVARTVIVPGYGEVYTVVRRQNIWHNSRRKLAECGPRPGVD